MHDGMLCDPIQDREDHAIICDLLKCIPHWLLRGVDRQSRIGLIFQVLCLAGVIRTLHHSNISESFCMYGQCSYYHLKWACVVSCSCSTIWPAKNQFTCNCINLNFNHRLLLAYLCVSYDTMFVTSPCLVRLVNVSCNSFKAATADA